MLERPKSSNRASDIFLIEMNNKAEAFSKGVSVPPTGSSKRTSTISPSYEDDHDFQESSWATYIDHLQKQQNNTFMSDSFNEEDTSSYSISESDHKSSWSANKLHDYCRKTILKNRMIIKMNKGPSPGGSVVDEELEDTACSPRSSPKVVQEKPALISGTNVFGDEEKDCTELRKRGLCLVSVSVASSLNRV